MEEKSIFDVSELDVSECNDKSIAEEVFGRLLKVFLQLEELNKKTDAEYERIEQDKVNRGISKHQFIPEEKNLANKYYEEYRKIAFTILTQSMQEEFCKNTIGGGSPSPYEYLTRLDMNRKVKFIMKSKKKIIIETGYHWGMDLLNKYELRQDPATGDWNIDRVYYGFSDGTWYRQHDI